MVCRLVFAVYEIFADRLDDGTQGRNYLAPQSAAQGSRKGRMSIVTLSGSFTDDALCAHAVEALRNASVEDISTFSPVPSHRIEHAFGRSRSPVRWIALTGGISGVLSGLAITIGTTYEWRLNAGGP